MAQPTGSPRAPRREKKRLHGTRQAHPAVPEGGFRMPDASFWLRAGMLLLLCLVAYGSVLRPGAGFVWDDVAITDNRVVVTPSGLFDIWLRPAENTHEEHYWPLVYTTFWLEYRLWGPWAPGYHAVNVLLHAANCVLIWTLLRRLGVAGGWFAAALFAVHPVHAESVAWVIERKDVLSGLFYLLAFHQQLEFAERRRPRHRFLALGLFVAGMLSKSIVVTLPVAVLIALWWRRGRLTWRDVVDVAPMFAIGFAMAAADSIRGRLYYPNRFEIPLAERLLIAPRAFWFYLEKLVWPAEQMALYPKFINRAAGLAALAAALVTPAVLWVMRKRTGRAPLAVFLFYAVTLAPILGFITFGFMQYSYVADRFQYLASIAPIALFAAGAASLVSSRTRFRIPAGVAGTVLIGGLAYLTFHHAFAYGSAEVLWSRNVARNPQAWEAHQQLGRLLADRGLLEGNTALGEQGIQHLLKAIELNPRYHEAHANLGMAYHVRGRAKAAEAHLRQALAIDPDFAPAHNGLGAVLAETGRYAESIPHFEEALDINPWYTEAADNLKLAREEMAKQR